MRPLAKFVDDPRPVLILHGVNGTDVDFGSIEFALLLAQKGHAVVEEVQRRGDVT